MRVYLDNAATTRVDEQVFEAMKPYFTSIFGNPSSIHTHGREAKAAVEKSRKTIADLLNTTPSEIFFTSGGTEADNTAIRCTVETLGIKHCITSAIEHHAVLHTMELLEKQGKVSLSFVKLREDGHIGGWAQPVSWRCSDRSGKIDTTGSRAARPCEPQNNRTGAKAAGDRHKRCADAPDSQTLTGSVTGFRYEWNRAAPMSGNSFHPVSRPV